MPTPPSGYGEWAATIQTVGAPHLSVVTCGFKFTGIPSAASLNAGLRNAMQVTNSIFRPSVMGSQFSIVSTYVLQNLSGVLFSDLNISPLTGTATVASPPLNTAIIAQKKTALAGRQYRGRMMLPPLILAEANVDAAGTIFPATVTTINAALLAFYNAVVAAGLEPYLLHDTPKSGVTPAPTLINSFQCAQLIGTMKRRIRR